MSKQEPEDWVRITEEISNDFYDDLCGDILTIIDAVMEDGDNRKATKDLIRASLSRRFAQHLSI